MNHDDTSEATRRIATAVQQDRRLPDGRCSVRFDRTETSYDPTPDLDGLQVEYDVAVVRGRATASAWFEARFHWEA